MKQAAEIRIVRNGYVVLHPYELTTSGYSILNESFVFETFDGLVNWLKTNLEIPSDIKIK